LLGCGNQGGFRPFGKVRAKYVVLYSSLGDRDWPDTIDPTTGLFSYYGDNKTPGHQLHETPRKGNLLLSRVFEQLHAVPPRRDEIPPFFVFTKSATYNSSRSVQFRGLAVPGGQGVSGIDDLVAVWRSSRGQRFQNYRALFTILDVPVVGRDWIQDLENGNPLAGSSPKPWRSWVYKGQYKPLHAQPTINFRTEEDQRPSPGDEAAVVNCLYDYFKANPVGFESCAAALATLLDPNLLVDEITRPAVDGGRDAIGRYRLGPRTDPIYMDFALEAKCYCPGLREGEVRNSVGVRETSRLISRLRYRQFGILITTSVVAKQAYAEIRQDQHPIIILCGRDLARLLASKGYASESAVVQWLRNEFPVQVDPQSISTLL
jgi:hypothetical protein